MIEAHLDETELVQFAFGDVGQGDEAPQHIAECTECRGVIDALRTQASALRMTAAPAIETTPDCLDEEIVAAFAAGNIGPADSPAAVAHLQACSRCCQEVASVARLLNAASVSIEVERLDARAMRSGRRRFMGGLLIAGALAAGLLVMLVPGSTEMAKRLYREESVTGAAAPRLVAPVGTATPADTFRWTSVPRADRYRITVFQRDGSVIFETQTRDTAIALPDRATRVPNDTILWRVDAHVGWEDRWASSDLSMLTVRRAQR